MAWVEELVSVLAVDQVLFSPFSKKWQAVTLPEFCCPRALSISAL